MATAVHRGNQTYTLNGKRPYVQAGRSVRCRHRNSSRDTSPASGPECLSSQQVRSPGRSDLSSRNSLDRYAPVKAVRDPDDLARRGLPLIEKLFRESAKSVSRWKPQDQQQLSRFWTRRGTHRAHSFRDEEAREDEHWEAIFILTELSTPSPASRRRFGSPAAKTLPATQRRQAAIWGLGKTGHRAYAELLPFIADARGERCASRRSRLRARRAYWRHPSTRSPSRWWGSATGSRSSPRSFDRSVDGLCCARLWRSFADEPAIRCGLWRPSDDLIRTSCVRNSADRLCSTRSSLCS